MLHRRYPVAAGYLPRSISKVLFGDRERHGIVPVLEDPDWREWERLMPTAYDTLQRRSVGAVVNAAGYRVMQRVDLGGRHVLEIGPGDLPHMGQWRGVPSRYTLADIRQDLLDRSTARLEQAGVRTDAHLLPDRLSRRLPFADETFDVVVSFYSLEHLHPIDEFLSEIRRVLRPGGALAGAIPCEGGLAWGTGRLITSRRWFKRHTTIDPDKLICWEHPNFASAVLRALDRRFHRQHVRFWPLGVPLVDVNLVVRFVYLRDDR
jgi:SAM-dependent methyltransferase